MKKIPTLFQRDYTTPKRRVLSAINPVCDWVSRGEGVATLKVDGTCCRIHQNILFKRYDRRPSRRQKRDKRTLGFELCDFKPAPAGWVPCEPEPDLHTGHWPGWIAVTDGPEDRYHREAYVPGFPDGTYELVGPKVQSNPHGLSRHVLWKHGQILSDVPRTFDALAAWLSSHQVEGIVWLHPSGQRAKIKRKDFGFCWP